MGNIGERPFKKVELEPLPPEQAPLEEPAPAAEPVPEQVPVAVPA